MPEQLSQRLRLRSGIIRIEIHPRQRNHYLSHTCHRHCRPHRPLFQMPTSQIDGRIRPYVRSTALLRYPTGKGYLYPSSLPGCANGTVMVTSNCATTDPSSSNLCTDPTILMTLEGSAYSSPYPTPSYTQRRLLSPL